MRKTLLLIILSLVFLAGCMQEKETAMEFLDRIEVLDQEFGTNYRMERANVIGIRSNEIKSYLEKLDEIYSSKTYATEKDKKWRMWLYEARKQTLLSQLSMQKAWLEIGEQGRVVDGFKCSDYEKIQESTTLLEETYILAKNATYLYDAILTESKELRDRIGVNKEKPAIYASDFEGMYVEIESNIKAMKNLCNKSIIVNKIEFVKKNLSALPTQS